MPKEYDLDELERTCELSENAERAILRDLRRLERLRLRLKEWEEADLGQPLYATTRRMISVAEIVNGAALAGEDGDATE